MLADPLTRSITGIKMSQLIHKFFFLKKKKKKKKKSYIILNVGGMLSNANIHTLKYYKFLYNFNI